MVEAYYFDDSFEDLWLFTSTSYLIERLPSQQGCPDPCANSSADVRYLFLSLTFFKLFFLISRRLLLDFFFFNSSSLQMEKKSVSHI